MEKHYYIGLDNGGSVTKAGLYDQEGKELATARRVLQLITPQIGFVERDAEALFEANIECIKEVLLEAGVQASLVRAVSVTGHGNGLYMVGEDGKASYNGIVSTDTRAAAMVEEWYRDGTFLEMLPRTTQSIWAGQYGPLLAWFARYRPEVLKRTAHAFPCTDYIRFRLTGEAAAEISNISASSLFNNLTKEYDQKTIRLLGIEEYKHLLSPVRRSHDICGHITKEVAEATGLLAGTPVAGGCLDVSACTIATGVMQEDQMSVITGTWTMNSYVSKELVVDKDLFMCYIHPEGDRYQILEGSMTSASNLEWFVQNFMDEEERQMRALGKSVYEACNEMIEQTTPKDPPIVFLPYLFGTNVNARARACFLGLSCMHQKKDLVRAIYEGVVFSAMMHIEALLSYKKTPTRALRISGGVANSRQWLQLFCDTLQKPLEVAASKELGTMGAAMIAAISVGDFASYEEATQAFVRVESVFLPQEEEKEVYRKKYALYKKLVDNMDGVWKEWDSFL